MIVHFWKLKYDVHEFCNRNRYFYGVYVDYGKADHLRIFSGFYFAAFYDKIFQILNQLFWIFSVSRESFESFKFPLRKILNQLFLVILFITWLNYGLLNELTNFRLLLWVSTDFLKIIASIFDMVTYLSRLL